MLQGRHAELYNILKWRNAEVSKPVDQWTILKLELYCIQNNNRLLGQVQPLDAFIRRGSAAATEVVDAPATQVLEAALKVTARVHAFWNAVLLISAAWV